MNRRWGVALRFAAGLAVSGVFIWLVLRDKDLGAMWRSMASADYRYLVPYVAILLVIHLFRTLRWGILLEPVGKLSFRTLNRACAIGFMALVTLPFRLGELARPYLVSARATPPGEPSIRMSAATASVVVERVVDAIVTALMLLGALVLTVPRDGSSEIDLVRGWAWAILAAFLVLLGGLVLTFWQRERAVALVLRLLTPVSGRLADRVAELVRQFTGGLRLVPHRGKLVAFVLLTVGYWGINGAGMRLLAQAFGIQLSFIEAYTVLGVLVIGVMIPAGPGMVGTFQFFVLLGLSLFVSESVLDGAGVAYANVLWATQFGQQVLLGMLFLALGNVSFSRLVSQPTEAPSPGDAQDAA